MKKTTQRWLLALLGVLLGVGFAGELLDTDAYTGGFNLQIAFSTAHLAAVNAAKPILLEE